MVNRENQTSIPVSKTGKAILDRIKAVYVLSNGQNPKNYEALFAWIEQRITHQK